MHFKQSYSLSSHLYAANAAASQRFLPLFLFVLNKNQMEVLPPDERLRLCCCAFESQGDLARFFMLCIEYTYTHISINEILPAADPPVVISTPSQNDLSL